MQDAELARTISRWQRQVWEQIYLQRAAAAREALATARNEWIRTLGSPDARRALEIYLQLLEYDCGASFAERPAEKQKLVRECIARVEPPARTRLAASCRARVLLSLRCIAHTIGARELTADEARGLLAELPLQTLGHQTCMYLALWAFAARSSEHLQLAYKLFLTNPYDFMLDFSRQRVRVMLSLVEGECTAGEVARLIDCLPHPLHLAWFSSALEPELARQGLWSAELQDQLEQKRASLTAAEATVPPRREVLSFEA